MIKVSVFYPNNEGAHFDMEYYCDTHLPLVQSLLGDSLIGGAADAGIAGGVPGTPAPYVAMGHLIFDGVESFMNSFGPNAEKIQADIPNFTNVEPLIQVSEIKK